MAKIRMLPEDVIGKIAAGEVVERPAAAIKELVENSLDAGAKRISVEIEEGGLRLFRVTDDGCGIEEGDLRMAFERHATSKIRSEKDLQSVGTLGFRGEALASIAAVSRVTLTTRTKDRESGLRVKNEGGQITGITEAACAPGTGILVKDLFFNVPVRRDFQKKPAAEANTITDLMAKLILSRPDVSFRYGSDGKMIYHSPGDGRTESAVLAVYGSRVVRTLRKVEGHQNGILIRGFVGIGDNARINRSGENFFINGRILRSPVLSGSLEDACRERVMIGKHPICILYLEMPYENINVNVHPNKLEVRFRSDQSVRDAVFMIVSDALQERDAFQRPTEMTLVPAEKEAFPDAQLPGKNGVSGLSRNAVVETGTSVPDIRMLESVPDPVYKPVEKQTGVYSGNKPESVFELPPPETREKRAASDQKSEKGTSGILREREEASSSQGPLLRQQAVEQAAYSEEKAEQIRELPPDLLRPMRILGALFHTFILIEYEDHLLMVDQHAVHERLLFDRMMKACDEQQAGQEMLVPYIVPVTKKDIAILEEHRDLLERIGLSVEVFGENEVAIRSVPVMLGQNESAAFLHEAIDELENGRAPGKDKKRAAILQMACKHAVKGGEALPEEVLRSLVEEMIDRKVTPTCPHGRPLVISISHTELDKKFKRIQ